MIRRSFLQPASRIPAATAALAALLAHGAGAEAAQRRSSSPPVILENTLTGAPIMAVVAIKDQRVSLYDANGGVIRARISSGRTGYESPVGVFSILQKNRDHHSNLYDDASMPFMQRLTWSGVALHAGDLPGYPASHGCVRLPYSFAEDIFSRTKVGMRVVLVRDNVSPIGISHVNLPKPAPAGDVAVVSKTAFAAANDEDGNPFEPNLSNWPTRQAQFEQLKADAVAKLAAANATTAQAMAAKKLLADKTKPRLKAQHMLAAADSAKKSADDKVARADRDLISAKPSQRAKREDAKLAAQQAAAAAEAKRAALAAAIAPIEGEFQSAQAAFKAAETVKNAAFDAAKEAERKTLPVSIFISRKTQTLYVRQGHEPVFDTPVTIAEPDKPIGTYVYTAVDYAAEGADLKWTAVSLLRNGGSRDYDRDYDRDYNRDDRRDDRRADSSGGPPPTDIALATGVLDRITMPPAAMQRIAGYVWPGSSLIVSDEAQSKETGKATDNIIVVSTEPQGALKTRPRRPAPSNWNRYGFDEGYGYGGYGYPNSYYRYDKYGRPQRYFRPQPPKSIFWW